MTKDDNFATQADLAAELTILDILRAARPGDRFLAGESGTTGDPSDRTWLIDPLCGTRNFAAGTPLVAVNSALRAAPRSASGLVEIDADNPSPYTDWFSPAGSWPTKPSWPPAIPAFCPPHRPWSGWQRKRINDRGPVTLAELPGGVQAWSVTSQEILRTLLLDPCISKDARQHLPAFIKAADVRQRECRFMLIRSNFAENG
ncbi:inositol monophosphatase family protein [Nocardia sp. NPDC059229]|uniref:inositol monophosphatase family protein n=1 Tax=Nocardia sp. NPDC059229 TaxID=3346778 RepID=UPI0036830AD2